MAASAMVKFLALAARQMREEADRRRYEVSSSPTDRVDPSTIYRFEKGRWPENADRVIDLYAADLSVEPVEIWARALALWQQDELTVSETEPAEVVADVVDRLVEAAGSPPRTTPARAPKTAATRRRRRA